MKQDDSLIGGSICNAGQYTFTAHLTAIVYMTLYSHSLVLQILYPFEIW